jgi:tetraacyldisaccharide 4'-kinase
VRRKLRRKLENIVQTSAEGPQPAAAVLLEGLSVLYGLGVRMRLWLYRKRILQTGTLPCKVISIGNLTVGGTGKTPMAIMLACRLQRYGYRVAVVSRGYRGRLEKKGAVVSDGRTLRCDARAAGDEPYLVACRTRAVPVVIGRDRFRSGLLACSEFQPDVLLLDDAFQHLRLARDLNLVLLDYQLSFGNRRLLPRGPLREPIAELARGDAFILTRTPADAAAAPSANAVELKRRFPTRPIFSAHHVPFAQRVPKDTLVPADSLSAYLSAEELARLNRQPVVAFCGIARNHEFLQTIAQMGFAIAAAMTFSDHHRYTHKDAAAIADAVRRNGATLLMTTDKDHARIDRLFAWPVDLLVVGVRISFGADEAVFDQFLRKRLGMTSDE